MRWSFDRHWFDMWATCDYRFHMSKMIQLRNVPDALHRKLKARAAEEGMTLSDYLIREARRASDVPTDDEIRARLATLARADLRTSPTEIVRQERDRR